MTTPHPSPPRRWPWLRFAGLVLLALVMAAVWKPFVRYQADSGLRAAGFSSGRHSTLEVIRAEEWRDLLKRETWREDRSALFDGNEAPMPIRDLHAFIADFRRLKIELIYLQNCPVLQNVDGLNEVPTLTELRLLGCPALQNVDGLKGLAALRTLEFSSCAALENVDGLHGLTKLEYIGFYGCDKLSPESVAALKAALPNTNIVGP